MAQNSGGGGLHQFSGQSLFGFRLQARLWGHKGKWIQDLAVHQKRIYYKEFRYLMKQGLLQSAIDMISQHLTTLGFKRHLS